MICHSWFSGVTMNETVEAIQPRLIQIVTEPIDPQWILDSVLSPLAGAAVLFLGTTRQLTGDRETVRLEYDCYEPMALKKMHQLAEQAIRNWGLIGCAIVHRTGTVPVGEVSVAIATSSAHRPAALQASEWLIDELKCQVPIWKQELYADGSQEWVHPVQNPKG
jgi:molybdopterin synthase catalytic subunit